jgi:predicted nucleic acid-binding Zn ribbon protein
MNDVLIKECPKCKGKVKRLIGTGSGPIFKGTGFYHTDYKKGKSERKHEGKSESKHEGKSENKPSKPPPSDSKEK